MTAFSISITAIVFTELFCGLERRVNDRMITSSTLAISGVFCLLRKGFAIIYSAWWIAIKSDFIKSNLKFIQQNLRNWKLRSRFRQLSYVLRLLLCPAASQMVANANKQTITKTVAHLLIGVKTYSLP